MSGRAPSGAPFPDWSSIETAGQLGYDADEYQLVQARVMEARLPPGADPGQLAARMSAASL